MGVKGSEPMASKVTATPAMAIVTIGESPMMPGILWAGTDDGNVH
jgi:hypothetical protein